MSHFWRTLSSSSIYTHSTKNGVETGHQVAMEVHLHSRTFNAERSFIHPGLSQENATKGVHVLLPGICDHFMLPKGD